MLVSENLQIINTLATVLEAIAVAATLIYVIKQTTATQRSITNLERETQFSIISSIRSQTREINQYLLNDESLANLYGYAKEDVFGFIILHDLETKFLLKMRGITDDGTWKAELNIIGNDFKIEFVQRIWKDYKNHYHPEFVKFVDAGINAS